LKEIYAKIPEKEGKKFENFRDFLEVFVAYHRYFNPDAK
jgi:CRISPR/Cas system CSM-associated protein Csm2 small subunit